MTLITILSRGQARADLINLVGNSRISLAQHVWRVTRWLRRNVGRPRARLDERHVPVQEPRSLP